MPLRRRGTTASRRTGRGRTTRSPSRGATPRLGPLWANPPVQPPGVGGGKGAPGGLPHADHCPGVARPPMPVVGRVVRPVPQAVAAPTGPAPIPPGRHGPDAGPQVADVGLLSGLAGGVRISNAPTTPSTPNLLPLTPLLRKAARGRDPGAQFMTAHRHSDTLRPVVSQTPPFLSRPPRLGPPDALPTARGGGTQSGRPSAGGTSAGGSLPSGPPVAPMATDPEPVHMDMQGDTRDAQPPATGPMEMDESSTEGPARLPSQPNTPRSRPRTPASTHPSAMWFCPIPHCARREGASPTGWGCLQSLVSQIRLVHLSTGPYSSGRLGPPGRRGAGTGSATPEVRWSL